jgi:hypothetical protein
VHQQLQGKEKNLHWADTHPLVQRWKTNVDRDGDYNKNRCTFSSVVATFCEMITSKTYSIIIIIIIIIVATGTISKPFRKYVSSIPGNHEVRELQITAILGTAHILRKVLM